MSTCTRRFMYFKVGSINFITTGHSVVSLLKHVQYFRLEAAVRVNNSASNFHTVRKGVPMVVFIVYINDIVDLFGSDLSCARMMLKCVWTLIILALLLYLKWTHIWTLHLLNQCKGHSLNESQARMAFLIAKD